MAKRRRLEVPSEPLSLALKSARPGGASSPPPIADVAGEAAVVAAAQGVVADIEAARNEGRLAIKLVLDDIDPDYMMRDRIVLDDADMEALKASIAKHGQRTPIEVVDQGDGSYGLISGYRRLAAMKALRDETSDMRFIEVLAVIRAPVDAGDAYVAMIEENEIRVGLSYYERARIAVLAAQNGVFADVPTAVDMLYAAGSKAKRSKIRSFVTLHEQLGHVLRFPAALPERLGLALVQACRDGQAETLSAALEQAYAADADAEAAALNAALAVPQKPKRSKPRIASEQIAPGVGLEITGRGKSRKLILSGPGVDDALIAKLRKGV